MFISDCCGVAIPLEGIDYGICPECKEHCEVIDEEENDESIQLESQVVPNEVLAGEQFEGIFIGLAVSNYLLGKDEYDRNPSYNNEHYHCKAEHNMLEYLRGNNPELLQKLLDEISQREA